MGGGRIFAPFVVTSDVDSQVELKVPVVWQSLRLLKSKSDSPMESEPLVICWWSEVQQLTGIGSPSVPIMHDSINRLLTLDCCSQSGRF